MTTSFGSDPEFLIIDKENRPKSAIDILPNPQCPTEQEGNLFYYDNVLAECTVKPGMSKEETLNNLKSSMKCLSELVSPYKLTTKASMKFPKNQLTHPEALIVACNPDNCAYTLQTCRIPKEQFQKDTLRSCGGHIHLGDNYTVKNEEGPEPIFTIYMMDLFVGIPSLFMDNDPTSKIRRKLYGQAGRFRKKEYGIEYRSLSNYWLQSPTFASIIYDLSMFAVKFVEEGRIKDYWSFDEDIFYDADDISDAFKCHKYDVHALKNAIDNGDKKAAQPFLKIVKSHLPISLVKKITRISQTRPKDLYSEWNL